MAQRDLGLEGRWRERLAEWTSSGLGVRAFCRGRGLIETAFYYWRRELGARDVAAARGSSRRSAGQGLVSQGPATPRPAAQSSTSQSRASRSTATKTSRRMFVPVTVSPDTVLPDAELAGATRAVEVRCPSGHVVRLSSCDGASLAAIFAALEPRAAQAPLAREAQPC